MKRPAINVQNQYTLFEMQNQQLMIFFIQLLTYNNIPYERITFLRNRTPSNLNATDRLQVLRHNLLMTVSFQSKSQPVDSDYLTHEKQFMHDLECLLPQYRRYAVIVFGAAVPDEVLKDTLDEFKTL